MSVPETALALFDRSAASIERAVAAGESVEAEAIHQLRVGTKRIRAVLSLVAAIDPAFDPGGAARKLKRLFAAAGLLRDNDVQIALARRIGDESAVSTALTVASLEAQRARALKAYRDAAARFDIAAHSKLRSRISTTLQHLDSRSIGTLAHATLARWIDGLEHTPDEDLHEVRKRTKQTHALTWMLARATPDRRTRAAEQRLDKLQKLLGEWHDLVVAETLAIDRDYLAEVTRRRIADEAKIRRRFAALRRSPLRIGTGL